MVDHAPETNELDICCFGGYEKKAHYFPANEYNILFQLSAMDLLITAALGRFPIAAQPIFHRSSSVKTR